MARAGLTHNVAIEKIYQVYGENQSVTTIINRIKVDKRTLNMHPSLQRYTWYEVITSIFLIVDVIFFVSQFYNKEYTY